jgi:hypothetical protein
MRTGAGVNMPRHLQHRRSLLEQAIYAATIAVILAAWAMAAAGMIR